MSEPTNPVLRARMYAWDAMSADDGDIRSGTAAAADAAVGVVLKHLEQFGQSFYPPSGKGGPTTAVPVRVIEDMLKELRNVSTTASNSLALSTPGSARLTHSAEPSSVDAGRTLGSSMTSEQLELLPLPESMSSPAVFPARARAQRASATGSTIPRPGSGERWPGALANFDPDSSS